MGVEEWVQERINGHKVLIISKTWCGFCSRAKRLFKDLGVDAHVEEIDKRADEGEIQKVMQKITGGRSVPRVFVGGKFIGGCDETLALHSQGKLVPLLQAAGVSVKE